MSPRIIVTIAVLTAAAFASWYLSRPKPGDDTDALPVDPVHLGFYLKSARILGTGPDGTPLYEIHADHAEQKEDGRIEFTGVRIDYSPESDIPWTVDADAATILLNAQRVQLRGHVRAISNEGLSGDGTEIRTQYLELDPEEYVAETDERVQIRIGERSLTATGMLASLHDNHLTLKSNVSGKFAP